MATGDNDTFLRFWSEINLSKLSLNSSSSRDFWDYGLKYAPCNKGGNYRNWFGNRKNVKGFSVDDYRLLSKKNKRPSERFYFKERLNLVRYYDRRVCWAFLTKWISP